MASYLQVMDVFCLPSTALESFGNAAVEAMAAGLPTVVFADGGGLVEHIDDGQTGFVVADQKELEDTLGVSSLTLNSVVAPERKARASRTKEILVGACRDRLSGALREFVEAT